MRLAMISPFQLRLGRGVERFHWALAAALARRGVEVDIWCWNTSTPFAWGTPPPGVRLRRVPSVRYYEARWASWFYRLWLRDDYDQVLVAFAGHGEGAALRGYADKYSLVFHFPREQVPHRYAEFAAHGIAARAHALIAPSAFVAEGVQAAYGRAAVVIPHGVDPAQFKPDAADRARLRAELGITPDAPILITLAALERRKGVQFVVRSLPELVRRFPNLQYWVLGEGGDRAAIEAEIAAAGMGAHVRLFGSTSGVERYLNAADVSILLAWGEAFGLTLVESMALGLPIVAAARPPYPEIVTSEVGVLVDENDPLAVAAALAALLDDPARRAALGAAGRRAVETRYNWDAAAEAYLSALIEKK